MSKVTLLYASVHHKNTKKVVDYIERNFGYEMDVIDITQNKYYDLSKSEYIIFASGIYFGTMHKSIIEYINDTDLSGKKIILCYTCGIRYKDYVNSLGIKLNNKDAKYMGSCYCRGYDTYGFLKKIGGIAKGHPNEEDCYRVLNEIRKLIEKKK
ncbi:flavodoxin [Streptococcus constellatus]|uniref:Flavodoxin n=1 Tax=Streptococcus constellatus TaxID=76860 RepID=A0A564TL66_STRCV|nr:flavodoxin domain-containing protein [Streptococcus constellatus]VUW97687.1 flavodoxin [Streptococcus gordonii]VUX07987.1 flavodoxin [Streptococcus constellatus]